MKKVGKEAMMKVGKEAVKYLGDYQFGVGVPNGAEAVLHSANRFLNSFHSDGSLAMRTVDFSNAFNLVDRSVLLREVHRHCPSIFPLVQFLYTWGMTASGHSWGCSKGIPWYLCFLPYPYTP
ncbi:hypothetical protein Hanom_Chr06g00541361 [Helianthus anomalus]